jgi:uncharacterized protein (TIGR03437 family)
VFQSWSQGGAASQTVTATSGATYTANYQTQYQLTTGVSPAGAGTVTPASGTYYPAGTTVNLATLPNSYYQFRTWVGGVAAPASASTTILMNAPQTVTASFAAPSGSAVDPTLVSMQFYLGTDPGTAAVSLTLSSNFPQHYAISTANAWLTVSPASGMAPSNATVKLNPAGMTAGYYSSSLTVVFDDGNQVVVPVQLHVFALPQLALTAASASALNFTASAGSTATQSSGVTVAALIRNVSMQASATVSTPAGGNWLSVTPSSGTTPVAIVVRVNPTGLAAGTYQGSVALTSPDASNSPLTIPVTLTVQAAIAAPAIALSGIVNAASATPAIAAPNTILSAFGTFPGCSSNAQVTVDGKLVDVFYSSATQINFLLPSRIASESSTSVQFACAGLQSQPISLNVVTVAPALFTTAQNGSGQPAVVNQDGSVNKPSAAGSIVSFYGTGFGMLAPAGADGLARLEQPVTATIGGAAAQVLYAGEAPGFTVGLQQINVQIPAGLKSGSQAPVLLTIGGMSTQAGVTLAIQ